MGVFFEVARAVGHTHEKCGGGVGALWCVKFASELAVCSNSWTLASALISLVLSVQVISAPFCSLSLEPQPS